MPHLRVALLGCGNVGRALLAMVAEKTDALREEQNLTLTFTGGLTRAAGGWIAPEGVDAAALLATGWPTGTGSSRRAAVYRRWRGVRARVPGGCAGRVDRAQPADRPARDGPHPRRAGSRARASSPRTKGQSPMPIVSCAISPTAKGAALRFESTVMDGTPIFGMVEACLPVTTNRQPARAAQQHEQLHPQPHGAGRVARRRVSGRAERWASPRPIRATTWRAGTPR